MAEFEDAGISPVYNAGVMRVPQGTRAGADSGYGIIPGLFADLLTNKDIVGGQVATGFVGDVAQPLKQDGANVGHYVASVYDDTAGSEEYDSVDGVLLLATDAHDGPRFINVVKGGNIRTNIGALKDATAAQLGALATALGGKYDATFNAIKF